MAKIATSTNDEVIIKQILNKGLLSTDEKRDPKWISLRLALALSLRHKSMPEETFDHFTASDPRKGEYALQQVSGEGSDHDYTDAYRAVLSIYHDTDLFADHDGFIRYLQRHIRRGLAEIERSWRDSHDFHEYLFQELFSRTSSNTPSVIDLTSALLAALHENGIDADIRTIHDGPRLQSYETVLTDATQLRTLQRARENIEFALARDAITLQSGIEPRRVDIQVPKPRTNWRTVTWSEVSPHLPTTDVAQLGVALGVDPLGIPVSFDLASAPHLLVGGTTGSGKSVCLHALISSLLLGHGPQSMRLCLIDPKQLEFAAYAALPDLWSDEPLVDASTALDALLTLVSEMEQREAALARLGYKQLTEWRRQQRDAPPYLVIVVEELADLLMQRPEVEVPLVRLAQKGRASGIHLILATQRPDSATFSGLLRSNIPSRIALTVQKAAESRIILDETGAEHLLGQGDMLLKLVGQDVRRVHGAAITSVDIDAAIRTARNRN